MPFVVQCFFLIGDNQGDQVRHAQTRSFYNEIRKTGHRESRHWKWEQNTAMKSKNEEWVSRYCGTGNGEPFPLKQRKPDMQY